MHRCLPSRLMIALVCLGGSILPAETPAKDAPKPAPKDGAFKLGEVTVVVTDKQEALETVNTRLDAEQIRALNLDTVGAALTALPGVNLTVNSRNEQMLYVRGNDSRQVPVFVDGIPVYVPYDGEMDYGRFTTFDLAEIQVAKGYSSILYGPNTLGGAINMVTRRPTRPFEGDVAAGVAEGDGQRAAFNVGTRQTSYYLQGGASYLSSDHWRLPSGFAPTSREGGGWRDNSFTRDKKASLKAGWTPNATDEYVVAYQNQQGRKGNPVCTNPQITANYWQWPTWNKESVSLSTRTALGAQSDLKVRAYYDTYENTIVGYTDATYTTINTTGNLKPTGRSFYRDFTHGALAEFQTTLVPSHSLRAVLQTKTDVHRDGTGAIPSTAGWTHFEDHYLSAGLEDSVSLAPAWDLSLGAGWDQLRPVSSGIWTLPQPRAYWHGQAGLFWRAAPALQVYATVAQKEHFPTLKDRYSLRFGTYIDNPGLAPERSLNLETGAKLALGTRLQVEAALFSSTIRDLIQGMPLPGGMMQMQNIGEVRHTGGEVSAAFKPSDAFQAGLGYTYLDRRNVTYPAVKLTGTPRNRLSGFVKAQVLPSLHVLASVQSQDALWDSYANLAKQSVTARLGGFTTANLSLGWKPVAAVQLDAGFTNVLDRTYQLSTGYPLPGRMWFANVRYRF